jgi:hypothetical protein
MLKLRTASHILREVDPRRVFVTTFNGQILLDTYFRKLFLGQMTVMRPWDLMSFHTVSQLPTRHDWSERAFMSKMSSPGCLCQGMWCTEGLRANHLTSKTAQYPVAKSHLSFGEVEMSDGWIPAFGKVDDVIKGRIGRYRGRCFCLCVIGVAKRCQDLEVVKICRRQQSEGVEGKEVTGSSEY